MRGGGAGGEGGIIYVFSQGGSISLFSTGKVPAKGKY